MRIQCCSYAIIRGGARLAPTPKSLARLARAGHTAYASAFTTFSTARSPYQSDYSHRAHVRARVLTGAGDRRAAPQLFGEYSSTRPNTRESHRETPVLEYPFSTLFTVQKGTRGYYVREAGGQRTCSHARQRAPMSSDAPPCRSTLLTLVWKEISG